MSDRFSRTCCTGLAGLAALMVSAGPSWAGLPIPAPLIGVTGPAGLVAAGVVYGGYLLFKRFKNPG